MESSAPTTGVTPGGQPPPLDIQKLVSQYIALRDRKELLQQQHKDQLAPYAKVMSEIEGKLLGYMQQAHVDSVATPAGTAYQSTVPRATIRDNDAFRQWVVSGGHYGLVDWRANAPNVFDFIKSNNGVPPPGVTPSTFTSVRFRRPEE